MIYVILVHGTFARRAAWTAPGAPLELALKPVVGIGGKFIRFEWSGQNSFNARAEAIADLSTLLRSIVESDPIARLYIVAHSHGGNIALQATRAKQVVEKIEGLVCLATPVITSTPIQRNVHGTDFLHLFLLLFFVLVATVASVYLGFQVFGDLHSLRSDQKVLAYGAIVVLAVVVLVAGSFGAIFAEIRVSDQFSGWIRRRADFILQQTQPPEVGPDRVIFFRHQGDEASALAGTVHLASWVVGSCSELLNRIIRTSESLVNRMFNSNWALLAWAVSAGAVGFALESAGAFLLIVVVLALVALGATGVIATYLLRLLATAVLASFFGLELLVVGTAIRLTAESSPPGAWTVVTLGTTNRVEGPDRPFPYAHGRVYEHPSFVAAVSVWIKDSIVTSSLAIQNEPRNQESSPVHCSSQPNKSGAT